MHHVEYGVVGHIFPDVAPIGYPFVAPINVVVTVPCGNVVPCAGRVIGWP